MVENFGLHLKHERELRGVALEEIAEATRIHIRFLEALENNDLDKLPGEVFIKGYIRSYARVIGFDSEEMVNVYDDSIGRNRKEEPGKATTANDNASAGKNRMAGYIFGGAALVAIVWLGYTAVENIIDKNKKQQGDRLLASEPASKTEEPPTLPETSAPEKEEPPTLSETTAPQKIEIEVDKNQNKEPSKEASKKSAVSVETETRPEPAVENPSPPAPVSTAQSTQRETETEQVQDIEAEIAVNPARPQEDKKEEPKTPIEPAVMEIGRAHV